MTKITSTKSLPLVDILRTRVSPLWQQGGMARYLVAPRDVVSENSRQRWLATWKTRARKNYDTIPVAQEYVKVVFTCLRALTMWLGLLIGEQALGNVIEASEEA